MTTDRDREEAKGLIAEWLRDSDRSADHLADHDEMLPYTMLEPRIAQALAARVQPFIDAGLADAEGKPRKVLGTLPLTADGCIVGDGFFVAYARDGTVCSYGMHVREMMGEHNFSTREAALASRKEANGE